MGMRVGRNFAPKVASPDADKAGLVKNFTWAILGGEEIHALRDITEVLFERAVDGNFSDLVTADYCWSWTSVNLFHVWKRES
jgi:hypothetical protein